MVSPIRQALNKIKRLRKRLFDFSHSKKYQPKKTIELLAIAVRDAATHSDAGMFCRVLYGNKKVKTTPLSKGDVADWKEHIVVSTYETADIIVECWRKKKSDPFKKFLGRIVITEKDLNDALEGKIRGWYSMVGRGKKKENIAGRMFVSLIIPGKQSAQQSPMNNNATVHNVPISSTVNIQPIPVNIQQIPVAKAQPVNIQQIPVAKAQLVNNPQGAIVVDRLAELRPEIKINNHAIEETIPEHFRQRTEALERIVKSIDSQLRSLQIKLTMLEKRGMNPFLMEEIDRLFKDIDDILDVGMSKIRQMGTELNSVHDRDLSEKMRHFNEAVARIISRSDEFQRIKEDFDRNGTLI